ncbi:MAG TPA: glycosyltransferase, partial [Actinomycetes bacterium]|nr:glycosyltransferase [Actinomycetes bacterium]
LTLLRPGYLPLNLLAGLLGEAELVAYPSLGEGFGLPVLEAMACGAPVVTTTGGSLPEIAGDAATLIDPGDDTALAAAVAKLATDPAARADAATRGLARAAAFTWERCAELTAAAYARAMLERRDD